jgi:hypothetical protein
MLETSSWNACDEIPPIVELVEGLRARGHFVTAELSQEERTDLIPPKQAGGPPQKRRYLVPVLKIPDSYDELMARASTPALDRPTAGALGAGNYESPDEWDDQSEVEVDALGIPIADPRTDFELGEHMEPDDDIAEAEVVEDPEAQLAKLRQRVVLALQSKGYGDDVRHALVGHLTGERTFSSKELSLGELQTLLTRAKLIESGATVVVKDTGTGAGIRFYKAKG